MRLMILSLGRPWYITYGGNCSSYSTILFTCKIKFSVFKYRGSKRSRQIYLLCIWCYFLGKKWVVRISINSLYFSVILVLSARVFCSKTCSDFPSRRFFVITYLWVPVVRFWNFLIFLRSTRNFISAFTKPVLKIGT